MNNNLLKPVPIKRKFFTTGVIIISAFAVNGFIFLLLRFIYGMESVTNLDNLFPWGIWNAINKAGGVALAAGGFTTAALGHVIHKDKYESIIRPALLLALLGYTFVAIAVFVDIGRWYFIWHPIIMWNGNSALFEVGICVMIYLTVLYIEFIPVVTERFMGKVNLPGFLSKFNKLLDKLLRLLDRGLAKTMFIFIIAGVVLSTLHQSSLGTLMVIAGEKMHPLWQTPILPLLFLLSAVAVGLPMVIMQIIIGSRSLGLKPEMHILSKLGSMVVPLLGIYLAFKIGDMFIRETFVYLAEFNIISLMFTVEIVVGIIIPIRMLLSTTVLKSPALLLTASLLVIAGVLINRINNFLIAYKPPFADYSYFPSFGEISISVGFIAMLVLLYRFFVLNFPVISLPGVPSVKGKYTIKGVKS